MQTPESRRDQLQGLAGWLIIVPIVLAILFGCGQLALTGGAPAARLDTRSKLAADYAAWEYVIIPPVSTAIIQEALGDWIRETPGTEPAEITPVVTALAFWPTTLAPIGNVSPTPSATPTDTPPPASPTALPVPIDTDTPAPTLTVPPTDTPTTTPSLTPTRRPPTATPTNTDTPVPPTVTNTNPPPPPPPLPTTNTPTPTDTPTASPTFTPGTPTPTNTPTDTPTPPTPTDTPTPTITPTPCPDNGMLSEPNVGAPDGVFREVGCGMAIIVDLGAGSPITTTHSGYDLVYYERENLATPGNISLDWVVVDVCSDSLCITAYRVFNWGDNIVDANTSIGAAGYGSAGEPDNDLIPMTSPPLYGAPPPPLDPLTPNGSGIIAGIGIDVSPLYGAPDGTYQWVRIYSPLGGANDGTEVDALYVIP